MSFFGPEADIDPEINRIIHEGPRRLYEEIDLLPADFKLVFEHNKKNEHRSLDQWIDGIRGACGRGDDGTDLVSVTFIHKSGKKVILVALDHSKALEQLQELAEKLFLSRVESSWGIKVSNEQVSSSEEVMAHVKKTRACNFPYLIVHVETGVQPLMGRYTPQCKSCQYPNSGYRYKCTECEDYEHCVVCEEKSTHLEHTMIRFGGINQIPEWIMSKAPEKWFHEEKNFRC